jgi:hypothetical protein
MAYSYAHMTKETSSQGYLMFVWDLGLTEDNKILIPQSTSKE